MKTARRRFAEETRLKAFNLGLILMTDARRRAHRGAIVLNTVTEVRQDEKAVNGVDLLPLNQKQATQR